MSQEEQSKDILKSICFKSDTELKWKQENREYTLKGVKSKERNFDDCEHRVKQLIENKLNAPVELRTKNIYAFSFYFDRFKHAKLINDSGGQVKIQDLLENTKKSNYSAFNSSQKKKEN